jgi:hypothetical protein
VAAPHDAPENSGKPEKNSPPAHKGNEQNQQPFPLVINSCQVLASAELEAPNAVSVPVDEVIEVHELG